MKPAKHEPPKAESKPAQPSHAPKEKKNLSLDIKALRAKLDKPLKKLAAHATFSVILLVLIAYLLMVWRISEFATAEPTAEAESNALATSTNIPKVNKEAVEQIQSLEASSSQLRSLFNQARNNPFQE